MNPVRQNRQILQIVSWLGMMVLFLLTACVGGNSTNNGPTEPIPDIITDPFQQKPLHDDQFDQDGAGAKARVLFVVDNSISMDQEQDKIGTAAPTIVNTIARQLPNVDLAFGAITTNTFGSADPIYGGTSHHNPNATADEITREDYCFDPTDLNSLYYKAVIGGQEIGTYCAYNWRVNGTQGNLRQVIVPHSAQTYPGPTGTTILTGKESNFAEMITAMLKVGVGGHWLESGAMALMQFFNTTGADRDIILDPNAHTAVINLTDFGDASNRHTINDSRNPAGPMDFNNPNWYTDLTTNFLSALQGLKASDSLFSYHVIGPEAATANCVPEANFNSRLKDIAVLLGGVTGDICQLNDFDTILGNIGTDISDQLNRQFNLNYQGAETILPASIVVTVNGTLVTAYTYIAPALILFDDGFIPPPGAEIHAMYWAPKLKHYSLSALPLPETIAVSTINQDGSESIMSTDTWTYNAITNSIDFVDSATAPQASVEFNVRYKPAAGEV